MSIKIVTDSSVTLPKAVIDALGITVVPLSVMIDGVVYSDNDLKANGQFLTLMKDSKTLPKTSQPPVGLFAQVYEELIKAGATEIISIHLSQSLSGTVEAARQGARLAGLPVTVVDSDFVDQALAFQVEAAAKLAQAGHSKEDILAELELIKGQTAAYVGVSTLENLIKGGRIGRVSGMLSNILNIKVIMAFEDGRLIPVAKGRGQKTFAKWLDLLKEELTGRQITEIALSYSGSPEFAQHLKKELSAFVSGDIRVMETGSIIQTHTGEGAFAVLVRYAD